MSSYRPVLTCSKCHSKNRLAVSKLGTEAKCGKCGQALPALAPIALDDASFDEVVKSSRLPVLVDFWASWCGPCRTFAPTLEGFARDAAGRVLVAKVDVDAAPKTAARFQVRSIPTIALFRGGVEISRQVGAMSGPQLAQFTAA